MARAVRNAFAEEESAEPSGRKGRDAGEENALETLQRYLERREGARMRRDVQKLVKKREEAGLTWPPLDQHVAVNVEVAELLNDLPHIAPDLLLRRPQQVLALLNQAALLIESKLCHELRQSHTGLIPAAQGPPGSSTGLHDEPLELPPQMRLPLPGDEVDEEESPHGASNGAFNYGATGGRGPLKACTTQQREKGVEGEDEDEEAEAACEPRRPTLLDGICPGNVRLNMLGSALDGAPQSAPSISSLRIGQHDGCLVTLRGIVIRCGPVQMLEGERTYACTRCGHRYILSPDLEHGLEVELPSYCNNFQGRKRCGGQEFKRLEEDEAKEAASNRPRKMQVNGEGGRHANEDRASNDSEWREERQGSEGRAGGSVSKRRKGGAGTWYGDECNKDMAKGGGAEPSTWGSVPDLNAPAARDIQEIRIQETATGRGSQGHTGGARSAQGPGGKGGVGFMPRSIKVLLLDHLADSVRAGEEVAVTGIMQCKWLRASQGARCNLEPVLVANAIWSERQFLSEQEKEAAEEGQALADVGADPSPVGSEAALLFSSHWKEFSQSPLRGRNAILRLVCPQLHGMGLIKLATCLALIGGVRSSTNEGSTQVRGDSHLLLVGEPGTGKSVLLAFAAALMQRRSVKTTGLGSSYAGLTATAIRESGQWLLEPGALVLAHGGICCVDDFNRIRKDDMAAMHEAMEQQGVSVAKAGLVTQLPCRCVVLAASTMGDNKGQRGYGRDGNAVVASLGLPPPLLSRFDLVLVIPDQPSRKRDAAVAQHIIRRCCPPAVPSAGERGSGEQEVDSLPAAITGRAAQRERAQDWSCLESGDLSRGAHASCRNRRGGVEESTGLGSPREPSGHVEGRAGWGSAREQGELDEGGDAQNEDEGPQSAWTVPLLQRYLQFVRTEFQPVVSEDAAEVLTGYYRLLRSTSADTLPGGASMSGRLTVRMLDSLVRLAQAHARLMCRSTVELQDAVLALVLMDASLACCAGTPGVVLPPVCLLEPASDNPDSEYEDTEAAVLDALGLQREGPAPSPGRSPDTRTKVNLRKNQQPADLQQYRYNSTAPSTAPSAAPGADCGRHGTGRRPAHGSRGEQDSGDELAGEGARVLEDWGFENTAPSNGKAGFDDESMGPGKQGHGPAGDDLSSRRDQFRRPGRSRGFIS